MDLQRTPDKPESLPTANSWRRSSASAASMSCVLLRRRGRASAVNTLDRMTGIHDDRPADDPVVAILDATGVDYEIIDCDPELADTAQFCEAYGYELGDSANTIVVIGKAEPPVYAACVVLATTRLDVNKVVRKRLGTRKASFASGEATEELTGMTIGGVTPFNLPTDMPVWVDARVMERDRIVLGGGGRDRKVIAPPKLLVAAGVEVVDDLAKPAPPA